MKQVESTQKLNLATNLENPKLAKSWMIRWLCIVLAWLCLILGTLGLIIPGLPSFDFYFLATIFAAKGSAKLHAWIVNHPMMAPILKQWQTDRTLPFKIKILSLLSMILAVTLVVMTIPHLIFVAILLVIMVSVQCWIWLRT
ncbi:MULTISPECIES: YbaN family protein [unclassified Acinetobacter]|uniref:YbaN family protein n=1 Tax=unclassified Acinetobacter TaxID=196816 RepID=UPI002934ACFC|nr:MULTISPECIES: YbaN family protein [unclassified Acinetobacter]WOE32640.1 YbaN family protein [Acinetobacter sp. SAAs470]WOE38116.1 YbaN family protein [Acinetobacter sp. SAAs474]